MARKSRGPWWWEARGQWYVTHQKKQIALGTDEAEARKQWHIIEATAQVQTAGDSNLFIVLGDAFLDWIKRYKKHKTFLVYRTHLEAFGKVHPTLKVADMKAHHLDAVIDVHPNWGKSTIRGFMVCVQTVLNWGVKKDLTTRNPLAHKLDIPPIVSRGGDTKVPIREDDYEHMLAHANGPLKDLIVACRNTGTRPINVATVTAEDFHEDAGVWILPVHKTDQDGQPLVVHLNPTMIALTKRLTAINPEGPLFRNNRGNPWTAEVWGKAMAGLRKTLKARGVVLKSWGIMYGFRHGFATDLLEAKIPDTHVAALMGHGSTAMLHAHYSHIMSRHAALKPHLATIQPTAGESSTTECDADPD